VLFGVSHIRVPTLTTTMADIIDCTNDIDLRDNVIVMEVDNLLVGWPAYEIKFTPHKPGPVVRR
jgi:hypothetical protein